MRSTRSADNTGKPGRISVRISPHASRNEIAGFDGRDVLKIRIAAPPVDGKANRLLVKFLAKQLKISRNGIRIVSGETGRKKILEIAGFTGDIREALNKEKE